MRYALVKDGKIFRIIVADPNVVSSLNLSDLGADEAVEDTGYSLGDDK